MQPVNITHDYTNCCLYRVDPSDDAASQHNAWLHQLLFIQSWSSWWWAASMLNTYRSLPLKNINIKLCILLVHVIWISHVVPTFQILYVPCLFQSIKATQTGSHVRAVNKFRFLFITWEQRHSLSPSVHILEWNFVFAMYRPFHSFYYALPSLRHMVYLFHFANAMCIYFHSATIYLPASKEAEKQMCILKA